MQPGRGDFAWSLRRATKKGEEPRMLKLNKIIGGCFIAFGLLVSARTIAEVASVGS